MARVVIYGDWNEVDGERRGIEAYRKERSVIRNDDDVLRATVTRHKEETGQRWCYADTETGVLVRTVYRLVHCFETLPQNSALSCGHETRIATNWPTYRQGCGGRHGHSGHRPPETEGQRSKVAAMSLSPAVADFACWSVVVAVFVEKSSARWTVLRQRKKVSK